MDDISIGPSSKAPGGIAQVGAQDANEAGTQKGLAGAEAKPMDGAHPDHQPGDSETVPDEPNDMISGRRNPRREDHGDAPPESERQKG